MPQAEGDSLEAAIDPGLQDLRILQLKERILQANGFACTLPMWVGSRVV
jgi:hypothetical protein